MNLQKDRSHPGRFPIIPIGDEWKDADNQTRDQIGIGQVGNIVVNLGANDVCAEYGHDQ